MPTITVYIWYDSKGKIIAIGRAPGGGHAQERIIPNLKEDQYHIEAHVQEEHIAKLHETHVVDTAKRALREKGKTESA